MPWWAWLLVGLAAGAVAGIAAYRRWIEPKAALAHVDIFLGGLAAQPDVAALTVAETYRRFRVEYEQPRPTR